MRRIYRKIIWKKSIFYKIFTDTKGELLLEYGLLIGLAIILFITIISTVDGIYEWIENNISKITDLLD